MQVRQDCPVPAPCTKNSYPDQASARLALARIREKRAGEPRLPVRVYPCDQCPGWHVTAKRNVGKTPPWDRDPNWQRPT